MSSMPTTGAFSPTPGCHGPVLCSSPPRALQALFARRPRASRNGSNRYIREAFLSEATHQGISSLEELNDLFFAWAEQVANRRVHAETNEAPIDRFERTGPHRQVDPDQLREAFRWSVTRRVTRTATIPLEGNSYGVDPALVGRRVELRYDPEDLSRIDVYLNGNQGRRGDAVRHAPPHPPRRSPGGTGQTGPDGDRLPRHGGNRS